MRHPTQCTARCVAVLSFAVTCFAQPRPDTVKDYATFCYGELGINETDVRNAMGSLGTACYYGIELGPTHEGIELARIPPGDHRRLSANFLKTCDTPAWLDSGPSVPGGPPDRQCYGGSYITPFSLRNDVTGALLCRHKTRNPGPDARGFPAHDDYDDIAMILHNKKSGKTCWFQTENGSGARKDGRNVPAPHLDTAGFWLTPSMTSDIQCANCHDNGPWMNSQWLYSAYQGFKDGHGKYETPEYGTTAFTRKHWPATDDFVTIGRSGLQGTDLPECTFCHKLSAKVTWPLNSAGEGGGDNGTYERWFDWSTGRKPIPQAIGKDYLYTHWMPTYYERHPPGPIEDRRPVNADAYRRQYGPHLEKLKTCMEKKKFSRTPPCRDQPLSLGNPTPAPPGTGAMVSAGVVETGSSYTATAAFNPVARAPIPVAVGHNIRLAWQADATYESCTVEATMPAGVLVPATGPSGPITIGTGSSWQLPETPPVVGPLTEPGIYEFFIYCENRHTASLQFQVGTTGPRSVVELVTAVNKSVEAEAVHSHSVMQPATTTTVRDSDSVEVTWIAYNVVPNSCTFKGPGAANLTLVEDAGSKIITFSGSTDQVFTFQCTGANDSVTRTVTSTLRPAGAPTADLAINAAASPNPVSAGANLTYTLTVFNNGPGAATAVTVTDNLPSGTTFVSCTATGGGICGGAGNNRTISFSSLAAGASTTISLVARVNSSTPGGTLISNTVSVGSSTPDPGTANNSATIGSTVSATSSGLPGAPSNLTAIAMLSTRTKLTWTENSNNESLFHIEHSRDGVTFKQIAAVGAGVTSFIFTLPDMTGGTTHYYRVRASNAMGYSAYSNRATLTMPGTLVAPSNLTATALLPTRTKLIWADNSDNESLFHIEHSRDGVTFRQIAAVGAGVTSFIFTLPDMTGGTTHYYRVRASNATGYSAYSNRATLTMPRTLALK